MIEHLIVLFAVCQCYAVQHVERVLWCSTTLKALERNLINHQTWGGHDLGRVNEVWHFRGNSLFSKHCMIKVHLVIRQFLVISFCV